MLGSEVGTTVKVKSGKNENVVMDRWSHYVGLNIKWGLPERVRNCAYFGVGKATYKYVYLINIWYTY